MPWREKETKVQVNIYVKRIVQLLRPKTLLCVFMNAAIRNANAQASNIERGGSREEAGNKGD